MMRDTLIIALEASWEMDPVRMERKLWGAIDEEERTGDKREVDKKSDKC